MYIMFAACRAPRARPGKQLSSKFQLQQDNWQMLLGERGLGLMAMDPGRVCAESKDQSWVHTGMHLDGRHLRGNQGHHRSPVTYTIRPARDDSDLEGRRTAPRQN